MKLGIYGAVGQKTCMGYPGNAGHIVQDAVRYAEWGVDMFKFDGCFVPLDRLEVRGKDGPGVVMIGDTQCLAVFSDLTRGQTDI